ncbi:scavenger receptor cysteine-rich type 1 protein M130-like [Phalacrocorax aristotelis]|uniref:scavenger receptor cysteine-rich type 1 protein M130-like n=1 Tax=Phalacrocorax aristotelis TaxID=126867 RepID=UPI003F4BBB50
MVPIGALGLLLCVQLCRAELQGTGAAVGAHTTPQPSPGLGTLLTAGTEELRLVGGGGRCAGRVEVKHDGEWGSVCTYDHIPHGDWGTVVCRQLGCGAVAKASPYAPFGQGTGRIWLQPWCRGGEEKLEDCLHFGWGQHYCGHEWDIGVTCAEAVELRLVGGGGPCAGRVEVKLRGQWGSVLDHNWDMEDAEVVCHQLGCGSATGAYVASTHFGQGSGPVSLVWTDCRGNETAIWECDSRGWGPYRLFHNYDVAVTCQSRSRAVRGGTPIPAHPSPLTPMSLPAGFARLVGGDSACAGRLEVRQGRTWSSVCEDHVDIKAAQVVCRELGCGAVLAVPGTGRFQEGTGSLWQEGFECTGTEPFLAACARRPLHGQGCSGHASIICSPYTRFRLANSSSGCSGRVEVEVGGTWGSVCATGWDLPDTHVLCHHLGCGTAAATAVPQGGSLGSGDRPLWQDTFRCSGTERHPGECPTTVLGEPTCPPGLAATINCSGTVEPLRLVEGESRCDGRLEVSASPGAWARMPAGLWDARGASVVCQQLGCGAPEKVYAVAGSGAAGPQGLRCAGTEDNLAQCNVSHTAATPTGSPDEVVVVCSGECPGKGWGVPAPPAAAPARSPACPAGSRRVRLAGGRGRCAGRVEVYANGTWATVCQESWDLADATVVCRQLGCGTALEAPASPPVGPGTGPLWPHAAACAGNEASLWDCPASAQHGCQRGGGAGAVCSEHLSLRLVGGSSPCSGHLEVFYNNTWGRVCAEGTTSATAAVVCRQLGCGETGTLVDTPALALAWLAWVGCKEGATSLWRCPSAPWHLQNCSDGRGAHITCDKDTDSTSGTPTPAPGSRCPDGATCTALPSTSSPAAAVGTVPVSTVLCVLLGTLLCLALGALAVQAYRARAGRRGLGRAADAVSDAVYEELDYTVLPDYQEVPSRSGSLSEGSGKKLPYDTGDSMEERDPEAAPDSPAQHRPHDGYDDAADVPQEPPAPGAGDVSEGGAQSSWGRLPPTGGSCLPTSPPRDTREPPAQPPGDTDYDDVGIGTPGTSL